MCGENIKGSRPSSQGWAPGVLPFVCVCVYVYVYVCVCVCVCLFLVFVWFVCGGLAGKWGGSFFYTAMNMVFHETNLTLSGPNILSSDTMKTRTE